MKDAMLVQLAIDYLAISGSQHKNAPTFGTSLVSVVLQPAVLPIVVA